MTNDLLLYHRQRADHCRALAEQANSPDIRRLHEQLAALHADHASRYAGMSTSSGKMSAA